MKSFPIDMNIHSPLNWFFRLLVQHNLEWWIDWYVQCPYILNIYIDIDLVLLWLMLFDLKWVPCWWHIFRDCHQRYSSWNLIYGTSFINFSQVGKFTFSFTYYSTASCCAVIDSKLQDCLLKIIWIQIHNQNELCTIPIFKVLLNLRYIIIPAGLY